MNRPTAARPGYRSAPLRLVLVALAGTLALATFWRLAPEPGDAQAHDTIPGPVLQVYSVGGVLTADGRLWQYHPEQRKWLTIDEAFRAQGKETKILPLPVPAGEIQEMATWGFLLTRSGTCWLYDLERNRWDQLPTPPVN